MSYAPDTIEMVAAVLTPSIWLTASEIQLCLPRPLARKTIRNVLDILLAQERALACGGRPIKWYRAPGAPL